MSPDPSWSPLRLSAETAEGYQWHRLSHLFQHPTPQHQRIYRLKDWLRMARWDGF